MNDTTVQQVDWRCHLGRHHFVEIADDNPEIRGQTLLECTRCGKHSDGPVVGPPLGPRAAALGLLG